jgi:hypothetical protein
MPPEFTAFPKMPRLSREVIVTEKIDGTNAQVYIGEDGLILAGSRSRWITPEDDNFGFAAWVRDHAEELRQLGPGRHFGEWWGRGINRGYGLQEKRFSLFNVARWVLHGETPGAIATQDPRITKRQEVLPPCCGLVPVLWRGEFDTVAIEGTIFDLQQGGSKAAPGYMNPEGIVVFHTAGNVGFKKTLLNDGQPKSKSIKAAA